MRPLIVGAVKNGVPAVEHVRFPLDGEWKYYGSSNEYIMYDVDVVADELHEYIYNDVTPGTAAPSGSDGSTDSDDPADNTTGTSSPAAGSHKTETVDPSRSSRRAAATTPPPAIIMTRTETDTIWTKTAIGCIINK